MKNVLAGLLTNWHPMRMLRMGIGLWGAIQGVIAKDWAMGLFGAFFLYQGVTNTGCCGTQACFTPVKKEVPSKETEFEEIK